MRRVLPEPLTSAALLAVWLLAFNSVAPGVVALGVLLAVAIPLGTHRFWPEYPGTVRYRPLGRLLVIVLYDIIIANLRVARLILGPRSRLRPTFFTVTVTLESPFAVTLLASIISLTPGTISADLSRDRRTLLVHGLDVEDAAVAVARITGRYEARLKEVFE